MYSCDVLLPKQGQQDEKSSSRIRKPATKFKLLSLHTIKKDDGRNFYHHSSIYNIREFKNLTKSPIFFQVNNQLNDLQTKVLVTDFQRKVASYLLKKKVNNSKNVQKYYSDVQETQQTLLNQSLCLNKYCSGIEVMLMDNNKMISRQVVPNERLQSRLLKFMEKYLNDDHVDYDLKMQTMTQQYKDIVRKIRTKAFKIRVPENYQAQMSDYNEYYQVSERKKREHFDQQFDQLADEIIQSLNHSTSQLVTSHKTSHKDLQAYEEEMADQIQPISTFQEPIEQQEEEEMKKSKKQVKQPKETKKLTKKQSVRVSRPSFIQRTEEDESQNQTQNNNMAVQQQQQQSLENIEQVNEEEIRQTIQEIAEELKKPAKKHMTKAEREEQRKRKKEIQRLHEDIERIKREKGEDFEYERTDSDSEERWRRQKLQGQFDDMFKPKHLTRRQSHQLDESEGENHEYASEQEIEDKSKLERVEQIIQQKKDPNFSYNPQEFWQKEVKINVKKPQLPQLPSQSKQSEQFHQFQKDKLQQQLQALHDKYSTKGEMQQQPQQQQQQNQQHQQHQQQQQSYQQSNQSSPYQQPIQHQQTPQQQQQTTQKKENQIQLDGYKMPSAFKTPIPSEKQKQNDQSAGFEQSFTLELKQSTQLPHQQDDKIISSKQLDKQPKKPQPSQKKSDKNSSVIESKKNLPSMKNLEQEDSEITKKIEEKLQHVQDTLDRVKLGVIEKLLSAPSVYDVEIQEYKLADFPLHQTVFPKLNGEDEKQIFQQLFAWQKEIHQTIPILQQLNRNLKIPDEDEGAASKLVSSDDDDDN